MTPEAAMAKLSVLLGKFPDLRRKKSYTLTNDFKTVRKVFFRAITCPKASRLLFGHINKDEIAKYAHVNNLHMVKQFVYNCLQKLRSELSAAFDNLITFTDADDEYQQPDGINSASVMSSSASSEQLPLLLDGEGSNNTSSSSDERPSSRGSTASMDNVIASSSSALFGDLSRGIDSILVTEHSKRVQEIAQHVLHLNATEEDFTSRVKTLLRMHWMDCKKKPFELSAYQYVTYQLSIDWRGEVTNPDSANSKSVVVRAKK